VTHDVELVEQDRRLRGMLVRHVAKRLPHVHHRQANATTLLLSELLVEHGHALLGAVFAAEPDRASAQQVAHHDPIGVAFANRDLVDADRLGAGRARLGQLRAHVLLLEDLDRIPVEMEFLGQLLDRGRTAAPAHVMRKALGIEGIVGQEVQPLALHFAATSALDAPNLALEIDTRIAAGQIANATRAPVVPTQVRSTTAAAERFFERRSRVMTRAFGSPKTPRTTGRGRKPGKAGESVRIPQPPQSLRRGGHANIFAVSTAREQARTPASTPLPSRFTTSNDPHDFLKTQKSNAKLF
jgi:hypothetical protein